MCARNGAQSKARTRFISCSPIPLSPSTSSPFHCQCVVIFHQPPSPPRRWKKVTAVQVQHSSGHLGIPTPFRYQPSPGTLRTQPPPHSSPEFASHTTSPNNFRFALRDGNRNLHCTCADVIGVLFRGEDEEWPETTSECVIKNLIAEARKTPFLEVQASCNEDISNLFLSHHVSYVLAARSNNGLVRSAMALRAWSMQKRLLLEG